jgi:hypothetical protein
MGSRMPRRRGVGRRISSLPGLWVYMLRSRVERVPAGVSRSDLTHVALPASSSSLTGPTSCCRHFLLAGLERQARVVVRGEAIDADAHGVGGLLLTRWAKNSGSVAAAG